MQQAIWPNNSAPFLGHLAAMGALFYGVLQFSKEIDEKLSVTAKAKICDWLRKGGSKESAFIFRAFFDGVFGRKQFSLRCLLVCASVTMALTTAWGYALEFHKMTSWGTVLVYSASNIPFDFLSLWITRLAIILSTRTTWAGALALLIFDFVLSTIIGFFGWTTGFVISGHYWHPQDATFAPRQIYSFPLEQARHLLSDPSSRTFILMYIAPSMITSSWIWFYVISAGMLRLSAAHKAFNIDEKPLQAVGLITAAMIVALYVMFVLTTPVKKPT